MTSHLNEYISNVYLSRCNYHVARSKLRHLSLTLNGIFRIDEWKINVIRRITSRWEANFGFSFTHLLIRREFVNLPLFQNNLYILRSIFIISPNGRISTWKCWKRTSSILYPYHEIFKEILLQLYLLMHR